MVIYPKKPIQQQTSEKKVIFMQWFLFGLIGVSIFSLFFLKIPHANASLFPNDAQTVTVNNQTATDFLNQLLLATSTTPTAMRTILAVAVQQNSPKEVILYCGSNASGTAPVIYDTMTSTNTSFQRFMMYKCNKAIYFDNYRLGLTGMTYVDYDLATVLPAVGVATTTAMVASGFTYGEILQVMLLIMLFTLVLFLGIKNWLFGVKVENPVKQVSIRKYHDIL